MGKIPLKFLNNRRSGSDLNKSNPCSRLGTGLSAVAVGRYNGCGSCWSAFRSRRRPLVALSCVPVLHSPSFVSSRVRRAANRPRRRLPGTRSSRQGCNPAGESPAVSIARLGHVAMPLFGAGNHRVLRGVNGLAALGVAPAVGAIWRSSKHGSLNITNDCSPEIGPVEVACRGDSCAERVSPDVRPMPSGKKRAEHRQDTAG